MPYLPATDPLEGRIWQTVRKPVDATDDITGCRFISELAQTGFSFEGESRETLFDTVADEPRYLILRRRSGGSG